ncbi:MAG: hypothetical protein R2939_12260 [Kofleriaceae bacterium]
MTTALEALVIGEQARGAAETIAALAGSARWPSPPARLRAPSTLAAVRAALALPAPPPWLGALVVQLVEACPGVGWARAAAGDWDGVAALAAARAHACARDLGAPYLQTVHRLYGVEAEASGAAEDGGEDDGADDDGGWAEPGVMSALTEDALRAAWWALHGGARPGWRVRAAARSCTVVVVPRREVVSLVELGATSVAAWSRALHELGHAALALELGPLPRARDERGAIAASRWLEQGGVLGLPAPAVVAARATAGRARAARYAAILAAVERRHADGDAPARAGVPPTVLVDDPGVQAVYARALVGAPAIAPTLAALCAAAA